MLFNSFFSYFEFVFLRLEKMLIICYFRSGGRVSNFVRLSLKDQSLTLIAFLQVLRRTNLELVDLFEYVAYL